MAPAPGSTALAGLTTLIYFIIVWPLVQGALVYNISAGYLGENLSAVESYRRAVRSALRLLGTQFLVGLVVILGFILLIVPGIIFSLWFAVVPSVVLLEGLGGSKALSRSRELMKGNLGKGFVLSFLVGLLSVLIGMAIGAALGMLHLPEVWIEAGGNLAQGLILPIVTAPMILLYYDLRIRKEAFDLERLSASLAGAPATIG